MRLLKIIMTMLKKHINTPEFDEYDTKLALQHQNYAVDAHISNKKAIQTGVHDQLLNDNGTYAQKWFENEVLKKHKNSKPENLLDRLKLNDSDDAFTNAVLKYSDKLSWMTPDIKQHIILNDKTKNLRYIDAMYRGGKVLPHDVYHKVMKDIIPNSEIRAPAKISALRLAARSENLSHSEIDDIIKAEARLPSKELPTMYKRDPLLWLTKRKDLSDTHKQALLHHSNGAVRAAAVQHFDHISDEDLAKLKNDKNSLVRSAMTKRNQIQESIIDRIYNLVK